MIKDLENFIEKFSYIYVIIELVEEKDWDSLSEHLWTMKDFKYVYSSFSINSGSLTHPIIAKVLFPLVVKYESKIDLFTVQLLNSLFEEDFGASYEECIEFLKYGESRGIHIVPFLKAIKEADKRMKSLK